MMTMKLNSHLLRYNIDETIISKIVEKNLSTIELSEELKLVIEITIKSTLEIIETTNLIKLTTKN